MSYGGPQGCDPAFLASGFVGGSMGDNSVILEGVDAPESKAALFDRSRARAV
ncbi:MAG: hypothetical protein R3C45_20385 [Phycisphaerales bacterium]